MKVIPEIIWLPILLTLRVPDEGYSEIIWLPIPLTLRVPDEGYSSNYLASYSFDFEGT